MSKLPYEIWNDELAGRKSKLAQHISTIAAGAFGTAVLIFLACVMLAQGGPH